MEKKAEDSSWKRYGVSVDRVGALVAFAAMAILESFAFSFHLPSLREGDLGLAQILYLGVRESGLLLLLLVAVLFGGWMLARRLSISLSLRRNKSFAVLALVFSLAIVIGRAFSVDEIGVGSYGTFATIFASKSRILLSLAAFLGLALLFYNALLLAAFGLDKAAEWFCGKVPDFHVLPGRRKKDVWHRVERAVLQLSILTIMAIIVICWLPYIVLFFPGCVYQDSADQLNQVFGTAPLSGHHPLFTTYLMALLVWAGRIMGSDSIGVLLIMLLQVGLLSYAFARVIVFVRRLTHSGLLVIMTVLFFALVPLWGSAATSIKKDALFCAFFVLLVVNAFELILRVRVGDGCILSSRGEVAGRLIVLSLLALAVSLVRNDGIVFSAALMVCSAVVLLGSRIAGRRAAAGCALGLLFVLAVYAGGYKMLAMELSGAQSGSVIEALSIPVQQTARFYIQAPEDVTPEIEEGVSCVLETEGLRSDVYNPEISDYVKSVYGKDGIDGSDLAAFFSAYLAMGGAASHGVCGCVRRSDAGVVVSRKAWGTRLRGWRNGSLSEPCSI